jgi:hypothetical protein
VIQSPASKGVNTEAEEATALEAVTRRQPVKTQQTEKAYENLFIRSKCIFLLFVVILFLSYL